MGLVAVGCREAVVDIGHAARQIGHRCTEIRGIKEALELPQALLGLLLVGNVARRHAEHGSTRAILGKRHLHPHPEHGAVVTDHSQVAGVRGSRLDDALAMQIVEVLILAKNEAGHPLMYQPTPRYPQRGCNREIGFDDGPLDRAQCDVPHRREVVELEVARSGSVQLRLSPAQLLILHRQLQLMNSQLMQDPPECLGRRGRRVLGQRSDPFARWVLCTLGRNGCCRREERRIRASAFIRRWFHDHPVRTRMAWTCPASP